MTRVVVSGPSRGEAQLLSGVTVALWVCLLMYGLLPEMKLVVFIAKHMHLQFITPERLVMVLVFGHYLEKR